MKIHYLSENTPSGALVSMDYGGPSCVMVTQMLLSVTDVEPRERHGVTLTKNMHNQADDLTAERAAKLIKDLFVLHLDDDGEPDETDVLALVDLQKTARQEALREAVTKIRQRGDEYMRDCEAKEPNGKKYRDTYEMRRVNSGRAWAFKDLADELDGGKGVQGAQKG